MKVVPSILAYCMLESENSKMVAWIDYLSAQIGGRILVEGSNEIWTVREVRARFPQRMVFDKPLEVKVIPKK